MIGAKIELSPTVTVEIEVGGGAKPIDQQKNIIEACAFWQQLPSACPMPGCGAALIFFARHPQEYHYYGLKCTGPKTHELNLSERKDGTSFYIKDDGWKDAYTGDGSNSGPTQATTAQTSPIGGQKSEASITKETVAELMRTAAQKGQNALEYAKALGYSVAGINALTEAQGKDVVESLKML